MKFVQEKGRAYMILSVPKSKKKRIQELEKRVQELEYMSGKLLKKLYEQTDPKRIREIVHNMNRPNGAAWG